MCNNLLDPVQTENKFRSNMYEFKQSYKKPLYSYFQCFGLLGVNGAGKTTTFNAITGEITPNKGLITFQGRK